MESVQCGSVKHTKDLPRSATLRHHLTATPEEVILDFGLNTQPFTAGRQDVKVIERVVMSYYTSKRLLTALGMTIQRHEQTFGPIELDVRRRALSAQA
jgi:hypothetical protein